MRRLFARIALPLLLGVVVVDLVRTVRYTVENRYWADGLHHLAAATFARELGHGVVFAAAGAAGLALAALLAGRHRRTLPFLLAVWAAEAVLVTHRALHGRDWGVTTERFGVGLPNALWRTELLGQTALIAAVAGAAAGLVWMTRGAWHGRRFPRFLVAAAAAAAVLPPVAAGVAVLAVKPAPVPRPLHVIFLTVDSIRSDRLDAYGCDRPTMPHVARFFRKGVQWEDGIAQANWTRPSYFSIVTSRYKWEFPPQHVALPLLTLAESLKQHGYRTMGFVQNPNLDHSLHFDQGFDRYYQIYKDLRAATMARVVTDRVDGLDPGSRPLFLFVHLQQPHYPYDPENPYLPRFLRPDAHELTPGEVLHYFTGDRETWEAGAGDPAARLAYLADAYDASLRATDAAIGAILAALERRGFLENALVILNGDHGEELLDHGGFGHSHRNLHSELIEVPFFLRFPEGMGAVPGVRGDPAANLDLYPTVLDALGIPAERKMYGRSLLPAARGEPAEPRTVFSNRSKWMSVTDGRLRLHVDWNGVEPEELFDLRADPGERAPLALSDEDPDLARLRAAAQEWYDLGRELRERRRGKGGGKLNRSLREDLEALGYLGDE